MEKDSADTVILWVDGNEPVHRNKRSKYDDIVKK
ncbi:Stealth CR1 domain-containing protein [Rhodohalobacter sp.]